MLVPPSPQGLLPGQIAFEAPANVRQAAASMGRTEDIRLSPSGERLAIACYARNQVAVAEVAIARVPPASALTVEVHDVVFHDSPSIAEPHGLDFIDEETLVVANRGGGLTVLRLPLDGRGEMDAVTSIAGELGATGSVAARAVASGDTELLAVHNWADSVTRYRLTPDGSVGGGEVVVARWLDLPDGLALSEDGQWLAVSNHDTHDVLVFDNLRLHAKADPTGILRGVSYPHGLRFAQDGRLLLVTDAAAPYVNVFVRPGSTWAGVGYPASAIRVMDDATFARGRHNSQEGGPKGLDVHLPTHMLVVTAESTPLAFFDLGVALEEGVERPAEDLVGYELERLRSLARAKAESAEARDQLRAVLQTKAWRLTSPARRAYAALRGRR